MNGKSFQNKTNISRIISRKLKISFIALIKKYEEDVLEKQKQSIETHFQLRFDKLDCSNPFLRDEQVKALETIEKELCRYQKLCQVVDGKSTQVPIQTVESKIAEIRQEIENNVNEHKRKRMSSIDYGLNILQKGIDEERFADNEGFRCVLDVLKLMNNSDNVSTSSLRRRIQETGIKEYSNGDTNNL